jgi:aldose 1-epimerase
VGAVTTPRGVARETFGHTPDGREVERFTLAAGGAVEARVLTYGGILQSLLAPDRDGQRQDVVLGFDDLAGYLGDRAFHGALVGRYANRIRGGRFVLDGTEHRLALNDGANHLHGGPGGFHRVVWAAEPFEGEGAVGVVLRHHSHDGEEGYPGALDVHVTYTLTADDTLSVDFHAVAERATPVNPTHHAYFDLSGEGSGDILGHRLQVNGTRYLPVDATLIPRGTLESVAGTPFDFRTAAPIGARIGEDHEQLRIGGGYDHCFALDARAGVPVLAARVSEPGSGRVLEVFTTEPGVQLYTTNADASAERGKGGRRYGRHSGFCLETQHFPDSPNQPGFPSTILRPGETFRSRTVFRFTTQG